MEVKKISKNLIVVHFILMILTSLNSFSQNQNVACSTYSCLEKNQNKQATIFGKLQSYSKNTQSKGKWYKFFKYEILLSDTVSIPITETKENYDKYLGKQVAVRGKIFYGIVAGAADGKSSNATGYRIDIYGIEEIKK